MKKSILLFILNVLSFSIILGQIETAPPENDSISIEITNIYKQLTELQTGINSITYKLNSLRSDVYKQENNQLSINDSILSQLQILENEIRSNLEDVKMNMSSIQDESNKNYTSLKENLSSNTKYWIIGISLILVITILLFFISRNSIQSSKKNTLEKLQSTRKEIEEESIKIDNKLIDLLEKQLILSKQTESPASEKVTDHSLALKVADEIVRIQKNLSMMEDGTKGKKQLLASVERIRANFEANGYEIVDMLNKPYYEGMKVQANFRPDETIKTGEQIISRVIKPQVNFNGIMIQPGHVEVNQGI